MESLVSLLFEASVFLCDTASSLWLAVFDGNATAAIFGAIIALKCVDAYQKGKKTCR